MRRLIPSLRCSNRKVSLDGHSLLSGSLRASSANTISTSTSTSSPACSTRRTISSLDRAGILVAKEDALGLNRIGNVRFFSGRSKDDDKDDDDKLPQGISAEEMVAFLERPEAEGSPFMSDKLNKPAETNFRQGKQNNKRDGVKSFVDGKPIEVDSIMGISEDQLHSFLENPEGVGSPFNSPGSRKTQNAGEEDRLDLSPVDVRDSIRETMKSRPIRPGEIYDPLKILQEPDQNQTRRFFQRNPKPAALEETGKEIHFMNVWFLSRFLSPAGRIMPRHKTGLSRKKHKKLEKAIKRARFLGLLPHLHRYDPGVLARAPGEKLENPLAPTDS